jgi:cob(I)alamin adenosyltransferase
VRKDDPRVKTYGSLDELQSHLGNLFPLTQDESIRAICFSLQDDIFVASSELASTPVTLSKLRRRIVKKDVVKLEGWIDELTAEYGLPDRFVVPLRSQAGSALNVARAVCRRCERLIVTLDRQAGVYRELVMYFNRLSDLLFVLAWSCEVKAIVKAVVHDLTECAR